MNTDHNVLVLHDAHSGSNTRTKIALLEDVSGSDPDELIRQAYEQSPESVPDTIMPGHYELFEVGSHSTISRNADHLEADE